MRERTSEVARLGPRNRTNESPSQATGPFRIKPSPQETNRAAKSPTRRARPGLLRPAATAATTTIKMAMPTAAIVLRAA